MRDILREQEQYAFLKKWQKISGRNNKQLAYLTKYFNFTSGEDTTEAKPIDDSTFGRVIAKIPTRSQKIESLFRILAVFYMLEVITREDIEAFISEQTFIIPDYLLLNKIWPKIEEGTQRGKAELLAQDLPSLSPSTDNMQQPMIRRFPWLKKNQILGLGIVLMGVGIALVWGLIETGKNPTPTPPATTITQTNPCLVPVAETPPLFIPNQGFSQFTFNSENSRSNLLSNDVRTIALNDQGVWVGYKANPAIDGVSLYTGSQWIHCLGLGLVGSQSVNDFAFKDGTVYVAVDGTDTDGSPGVAALFNEGWVVYSKTLGLQDNAAYTLFIDVEDKLWVSTHGGVAQFTGAYWNLVYTTSPDTLSDNSVYQMLDDSAGNRWFSLLKAGVSRITPEGEWASYFTYDDGAQNVRGIVEDLDGGVWFATDGGGVLRFADGQWTQFTSASSDIFSDSVYDVALDKFGRVWVATDKGVLYTADAGTTWNVHSTMPTLDIEFGCSKCSFNEDHIWVVLDGQGIGHVRIPPITPEIETMSVSPVARLKPNEPYVFEVEVAVLNGSLSTSDGDSLRSIDPIDTDLHGAFATIPVSGNDINQGNTYIFTNAANPIIEDEPGFYRLTWRVWKGRRFASEPIVIEFEVLED